MIIYISGYGRSGSTALDAVLGNHPLIFGCGELMWLFHNLAKNSSCSCGKALRDCPLWSRIAREIKNNSEINSWEEAAKISGRNDIRKIGGKPSVEYKQLWAVAFQAIKDITGKEFIVDSSKSNHIGWRRISNLHSVFQKEFKVLQLVRDPRAIMWSMSKGTNKSLTKKESSPSFLRGIRGVISWTVSNSLSEYVLKNSAPESVIIRYEDIMDSPQQSFEVLGTFLQLDLQELSDKVQAKDEFNSGHGVDGNRMRSSETFALRHDQSWKKQLSLRSKHCAELLAASKMRKYGYCP
ncbi:MAG: sulfotransferase [Pirellulales bacterium]